MSSDPRIEQLLEQILDSQRSPEEVCEEYPDLLWQVRERWQQLRSVEAQINELFPPSGPVPPFYAGAAQQAQEKLPDIPGYEVQNMLGRGGMGIVYKARHLKLDRPVAIKMLLSGEYASPSELSRFLRESQAMAALRHVNIAQVYDVADFAGRPYFSMEYVEGGTLAETLQGVPKPALEAAALVATLAGAVQSAHEAGIIHRDLKPSNILLTADGTPKISDCGLARRFTGESAITLIGIKVGTPSYMAPEQATGKPGSIGPAADIYSLGAILYEMLTGRPPFRGETASETERQLISEEPVPPTQLNAKVPRDLETICLNCLQKDPQRRYATAAALEEDIHRYERGEPIAARPAGVMERTRKWVRRRPALAAVVVGTLLIVAALVGSAVWLVSDRAATTRAVENDLQDVTRLQREWAWPEAAAALDRARVRLHNRPAGELRRRLEAATRDLELVSRLDAIGLNRVALVEGRFPRTFDGAQADAAYTAAFREAGLGSFGDDSLNVSMRIKNSNVKAALVAALDDWAVCVKEAPRHDWLLRVARDADEDPTGWRDRAREPAICNDRAALMQLAEDSFRAKPPVRLLVALGERLQELGADATPFLRKVQREHPGDFWANFMLGDALRKNAKPGESVRYYQAALAIRPRAAVAHGNLGMALAADNRTDEAIDEFREGIAIDPEFTHGHYSLGLALRAKGRLDEAIAEFQKAISIESNNADFRYNLALALRDNGKIDQAIEQFRLALQLNANHADAHFNLGLALNAKGAVADAIEQFQQALKLKPQNADVHYNLGLALKSKGEMDASIDQLLQAIRIEPNNAYAHYNVALALRAKGKTNEAIEYFVQALRIDPKRADTHFNLALALKDSGKIDQAIEHYQKVIALDPKHAHAYGALGEASLLQGRLKEAQAELRRCLELLPGDHPQRDQYAEQLRQCDVRLSPKPSTRP
jgi:serine/threonine-protein kinase